MNNKSNKHHPLEKFTINDHLAMDFLRDYRPEWLEEMPMMITRRNLGKVTSVRRENYDPTTRSEVFVIYWGNGANDLDNGWFVAHIMEASEAQFNAMVNRFCLVQELIRVMQPK